MSRAVYASDDRDQYMVRFPDGLRDEIKVASETNLRSMNSEIIHRLLAYETSPIGGSADTPANLQSMNANGPAETAISPEPGSTNPQQETEMNEADATTTPAPPASVRTPYELAYEAAMQSKLAERLADDLIGSRMPSFQGMVQLTPYEADVLMYAIHQARNSAIRVQEAL